MSRKTKFGALRLRAETLGCLRLLKKAYEECYGRRFTNDGFVDRMTASVEEGDPAVWDAYCRMDMERDMAQGRIDFSDYRDAGR